VYRLVLRLYDEKKGAQTGTPDDVKKVQDVHTAENIYRSDGSYMLVIYDHVRCYACGFRGM
jgi:hypothetical protein